mgnify:CR=1 FL=1
MTPGGASEDLIHPFNGAKKMGRLITEAVDMDQVGDARGDIWLGLFDEA